MSSSRSVTAPTVRSVVAAAAALLVAALLVVAGSPRSADAQPATADGDVTPLQVSGPPEESLNLIVLGDGYTADELDDYYADVDKHLNVLWSIEPFRSYRNYINVYRVDVASAESGISCDPDDGNVRRDTALTLEYAEQCPADPNARGITFGEGGSEALEAYVDEIPGVTPQNRQTLTLANTGTYGGIGGRNATTSGGNSLGPYITPHELGHSLGELQDEYPYYDRGVPGDPYTDEEPDSAHHTTLTSGQLRSQHKKWWRWLGEESLSGGRIGRYESGMYACCDIWRPSRHSMMRWLAYPFDQVSREVMTRQISGRRDLSQLAADATPAGDVAPNDVLWVETPHPTYHDLDVRWSVGGEDVGGTDGARNLDLSELDVEAGEEVTVDVSDPTEFVRDPALRESAAMSFSRTWTVGESAPPADDELAFSASTPTERQVGGEDVVFAETTHPGGVEPDVRWTLDGDPIDDADGSGSVDLGSLDLAAGTYELTATLLDGGAPVDERRWTVDNVAPTVEADLSRPFKRIGIPRRAPLRIYRNDLTMGLDPSDDQEGYVVAEFRLDGDGWHHYYGWPDAPEGTPFHFTPRGTTIKELVYGALSPGGMSWAPFEKRKPGYGHHRVEYRAVDAAGNIGEVTSFRFVVVPDEKHAAERPRR
ncbi:M64 family metallopeptidase [Solicola gregarius]|uniref:M64 family metallopeptidase n=1 Tax=Solicola gregarius TaxID=2908642 RepID=A0AA46TGP8_9ACTN|nr:M64 family metallopeptidase [Solicola gregarius]UYM04996.1 M64 family metallopeptidase [Solicola gregarius]